MPTQSYFALLGRPGSPKLKAPTSPPSVPIALSLNELFGCGKMPRRSQDSTTFGRNKRSLLTLPRWKLRMIYDMVVSKKLTVADMAEAAKCSKESINQICQLLQILAFQEDENPPPPSPTVNISILPAGSSTPPSVTISATSTAVDIYLTRNITVSVPQPGAIGKQEA